jgi:hypothetical protein
MAFSRRLCVRCPARELQNKGRPFPKIFGGIGRIARDKNIRIVKRVAKLRWNFDLHVVDERLAPAATQTIEKFIEKISSNAVMIIARACHGVNATVNIFMPNLGQPFAFKIFFGRNGALCF